MRIDVANGFKTQGVYTFEDSQFQNPEKNRWIRNAIPALFDVPNPPSKETISHPKKMRKIQPKKKQSKVKTNQNDNQPSATHPPVVIETPRKEIAQKKGSFIANESLDSISIIVEVEASVAHSNSKLY